MATVFIPSLMQGLTGGQQTVQVPGSSVRQIINNLDEQFPGMKERLVDGFKLKPNITVSIDAEVTPLGLLAKISENSEVHFIPAVGGGSEDASVIKLVTAGPTHNLSIIRRLQ